MPSRVIRSVDARATAPDPDHFTGEVWLNDDDSGGRPMVSRLVHFSPGARTDWHRHPGGQTLYVVSGRGRIGTRNAVDAFQAGDVVLADPGEEHWHGAAPDSFMVHLSVTTEATEWSAEKVADEDYARSSDRGRGMGLSADDGGVPSG